MAKDRKLTGRIALQRIEQLMELAEAMAAKRSEDSEALSRKYVGMARRIGSHYKVGMPKRLKNRICKGCGLYLMPGINCTVRISSAGYAVYRCKCGSARRMIL